MLIRVPKIEPWRNFSVSLSLLLLTNMRFLEDRMFALKTGQGRDQRLRDLGSATEGRDRDDLAIFVALLTLKVFISVKLCPETSSYVAALKHKC